MTIDGIILVDKPSDFTSFDVVAKARGICGIRKMGHGGTLDPMATGVLPLFVGRATKAMEAMPIQDKRYTAGFKLGIATDTQDITGRVISESEVTATKTDIQNILDNFRGNIMQTPPMYSAIWVDGQRLYDIAREGREVKRAKRPINILLLELLSFDEETKEGVFDIKCSKGTYVRTIIDDIGKALGCGATMTSLRRTETMGYTLEHCYTLEQLQQLRDNDNIIEAVQPISTAFESYPKLYLSEKHTRLFLNGVRLARRQLRDVPNTERFTVWYKDKFLATAYIDEKKLLVADKLFTVIPPNENSK